MTEKVIRAEVSLRELQKNIGRMDDGVVLVVDLSDLVKKRKEDGSDRKEA